MEICIAVPRDLTTKDVARISRWLATLSVDEDSDGDDEDSAKNA